MGFCMFLAFVYAVVVPIILKFTKPDTMSVMTS